MGQIEKFDDPDSSISFSWVKMTHNTGQELLGQQLWFIVSITDFIAQEFSLINRLPRSKIFSPNKIKRD